MLHNFLSNNRAIILEKCRERLANRPLRAASRDQLQNGVPLFLDQLITTLRFEQSDNSLGGQASSGPPSGVVTDSEIGASASEHGCVLHALGYTIDQVVHDYGDVCQAVTTLAHERDVPFKVEEFRTMNHCLDTAIARAVMEFSYQRGKIENQEEPRGLKERIEELADEMRNALGNATMAFQAAKAGNLSLSGATGTMLERALATMRKAIESSIKEAREPAENAGQAAETHCLAAFIAEVAHAAQIVAQVRGVRLTVLAVDNTLAFRADRDALYSALGNLIQNAFKFTRPRSTVTLSAYAIADRILIDVKDHCGGLPPDAARVMFEPFTQQSADKTGLGLGLSITKKSVETYQGVLSVKNRPGVGCIFTIDLPGYTA
ncbi:MULTISPECIES: HAMP domain-containing sensor histidine kinase [unclassified Caballeronia]|uniref:sensor histidine kinase n=1 Tax=unclassified Caballeronia TaxID=2646786 RepID=UPI00285EE30E|nr:MULTISPECIES: HAMP domain-containing sensor histidine kinase [unclassified Caballeronia]MDR5777239.1 HAMP domain-containing sensor histidine kinase [Caballeronia sp. LZ002]MDR5852677.1 HAMP domain-containing sensor histidine kinase [Caballeronia sp. LZ003]